MSDNQFENLVVQFLKTQEEDLKKALEKERLDKINENTIPKYVVENTILQNWNAFLKREEINEELINDALALKNVKTNKIYSNDDLINQLVLEDNLSKEKRRIKAFEAEGFTRKQASELVKIDNFLSKNEQFFSSSFENISKNNASLSRQEINKLVQREKFLIYKKNHNKKGLLDKEQAELDKINEFKVDKPNKELSLSPMDIRKKSELDDRITLRKQFFKSAGYSEKMIDELIIKEFYRKNN